MNENQKLINGDSAINQERVPYDPSLNSGSDGAAKSSLLAPPRISIPSTNGGSIRGEVEPSLDDKASLIIVMLVVFLGDTARGIFFPTLWTYVRKMGGNKMTLGCCVGAFSFGRVMISPYFGKLSTKHGYRRVLMGASGLITLGALCYAFAANYYELIAAQVILGVGSGTLGVTRAYVADKSTPAQRTYLLAYTTAVQYAGFTCMPFVGGFLSFLLESREFPLVGRLVVLDQFTAPAYVMAIAAGLLVFLLYYVFQDSIPKPKKKGKPSSPSSAMVAADASAAKYLMGAPSDASLATNTSEAGEDEWPPAEYRKMEAGDASGPGGLFMDESDGEEGQLTPISDSRTTLTDKEPEYEGRTEVGINSGIPMYQALQPEREVEQNLSYQGVSTNQVVDTETTGTEAEEKKPCYTCSPPSTNDMLIYGGFLLNMSTKGTIACFETLGAEYAMTHFDLTNAEAGSTFATFGAIGVISLLSMRVLCRFYNDVQIVLGGVTIMIIACIMFLPSPTGDSGLPYFMVAVFLMYSVGYPIGHTAVLGLFSKVVGAQPQGTLLGWFGSAGSLARIVFPVLAGVVSQELGTSRLFMVLVGTLCVTFGILFAFRKPYVECIEIVKKKTMNKKRKP